MQSKLTGQVTTHDNVCWKISNKFHFSEDTIAK
jgi:hypothetical protein